MPTVQRFEDLEIWQLSFSIYKKVTTISERIRTKHEYRFADQMKSAAGSAMDNIAEGFERSSRLEFINYLSISKGECGELKSQVYRCLSDKYITQEEFTELYHDINILTKRVSKFIIYLNTTNVRGFKFKDRTKP